VEPGTPYTEQTPEARRTVIPYSVGNGLYGFTRGLEVIPDWKPAANWRLTGNYSYLSMRLDRQAWSRDTTTMASTAGSSPRHMWSMHSAIDLPGRLEFSQSYRHVAGLPRFGVPGYHTADARFTWRCCAGMEFSVAGRNLLQPAHPEFGGNPEGLVEVRRRIYGSITWRR
jgi:iron complex outermembrane recepter protein